MRFLIDEMFPTDIAEALRRQGHDAVGVRELGLAGRSDAELLTIAVRDGRVVVTENAVDFVGLLNSRMDADETCVPVVVALKRSLPSNRDAMVRELADRLGKWCDQYPEPHAHLHWLS